MFPKNIIAIELNYETADALRNLQLISHILIGKESSNNSEFPPRLGINNIMELFGFEITRKLDEQIKRRLRMLSHSCLLLTMMEPRHTTTLGGIRY